MNEINQAAAMLRDAILDIERSLDWLCEALDEIGKVVNLRDFVAVVTYATLLWHDCSVCRTEGPALSAPDRRRTGGTALSAPERTKAAFDLADTFLKGRKLFPEV